MKTSFNNSQIIGKLERLINLNRNLNSKKLLQEQLIGGDGGVSQIGVMEQMNNHISGLRELRTTLDSQERNFDLWYTKFRELLNIFIPLIQYGESIVVNINSGEYAPGPSPLSPIHPLSISKSSTRLFQ